MHHRGRAAGKLHVRVRVLAGHGGPVHRPDRAVDQRRHAAGGDCGHAAGQAGDLPRVHGAGIGGVFAAAEKAQVICKARIVSSYIQDPRLSDELLLLGGPGLRFFLSVCGFKVPSHVAFYAVSVR